ncbi:glycosyltransferase family 2 protein, partial [Enterococcus faecalis]|nr:glycosyltransferase family 2 protein [Enterococcus faecalis]
MGNNAIKISFIVPVFNVQDTLVRAVQSIEGQLKEENYEIILIDDGSTDKSGEVAEKIKKKNSKINVYHKKNGGLSSARNYGLERASGELIAFLDSDDYYLPDTFSKILATFENEQNDMTIFGLVKGNEQKEESMIPYAKVEIETVNGIKRLFEDKSVDFYAWNKVYRKSLFKEVRFPEGKLYEDMVPIYQVSKKARQITFIDIAGIYYYQNENSIVHQRFKEKQYDNIQQRKILLENVKNDFPELNNLAYARLGDGYLSTGFKITTKPINKSFLIKTRNEVKILLPKLRKNTKFSRAKQLAL